MRNDPGKFELSESPYWSHHLSKWVFVEIPSRSIYSARGEVSKLFDFDEMVSNVCTSSLGYLVCLENRVCHLNLAGDVTFETLIDQPPEMRCNDGSLAANGVFYFGTMEKIPSGPTGRLYSLDQSGFLRLQGDGVGIPNTFVWLDDQSLLISDSLIQKTFKVELSDNGRLNWDCREVWLDLSHARGTPDGGTLDENGNVWLAIWGDAAIHQYSPDGVLLDKIHLDALQPTSCAFGGKNMDELLITTATEGMTEEQMKIYPDSGRVIEKNMGVKGKKPLTFKPKI